MNTLIAATIDFANINEVELFVTSKNLNTILPREIYKRYPISQPVANILEHLSVASSLNRVIITVADTIQESNNNNESSLFSKFPNLKSLVLLQESNSSNSTNAISSFFLGGGAGASSTTSSLMDGALPRLSQNVSFPPSSLRHLHLLNLTLSKTDFLLEDDDASSSSSSFFAKLKSNSLTVIKSLNFDNVTLKRKERITFSSFLKMISSTCSSVKKLRLKGVNLRGRTILSPSTLPPHIEEFELIDHLFQQQVAQNHPHQASSLDLLCFSKNKPLPQTLKRICIIGAQFNCALNLHPRTFSSTSCLKSLVLSRCGLKGVIEPRIWLTCFPASLEELDLSDNGELTGALVFPSSSSSSSCENHPEQRFPANLRFLNLKNNAFAGDLSQCKASAFPSLEILDIRNNNFCFDIAEFEWSSIFPKLSVLAISGNDHIYGTLMSCFDCNKNKMHFPSPLQVLLADHCSLSGDIDLSLLNREMKVLCLKDNYFDGTLSLLKKSTTRSKSRLTHLDISCNRLTNLSFGASDDHQQQQQQFFTVNEYPPQLETLLVGGGQNFTTTSSSNNKKKTTTSTSSASSSMIPFPFRFDQLPRSLRHFSCSGCSRFGPMATTTTSTKNDAALVLGELALRNLPPYLETLELSGLDFGGGKSKSAPLLVAVKKKKSAKKKKNNTNEEENHEDEVRKVFFDGVLDLSSPDVLPISLRVLDLSSSGLCGSLKLKNLPPNLKVLKLEDNNFIEETTEMDDEIAVDVLKADFLESDDDDDDDEDEGYVDCDDDDNDDYDVNADEFIENNDCNDDDYVEYDINHDDYDGVMLEENDDHDDDDEARIMKKLGLVRKNTTSTTHTIVKKRVPITNVIDDDDERSDNYSLESFLAVASRNIHRQQSSHQHDNSDLAASNDDQKLLALPQMKTSTITFMQQWSKRTQLQQQQQQQEANDDDDDDDEVDDVDEYDENDNVGDEENDDEDVGSDDWNF